MSKTNERAFPIHKITAGGSPYLVEFGLTKRELFAAMALQGLCACSDVVGEDKDIARDAVEFADALLAELAKEKEMRK